MVFLLQKKLPDSGAFNHIIYSYDRLPEMAPCYDNCFIDNIKEGCHSLLLTLTKITGYTFF